ncbi:tetratricopeptide repeat protein, partial [Myxococcota bacterium]|nr:tetratricopeptide repeat protein [Myxococcota bacterium]
LRELGRVYLIDMDDPESAVEPLERSFELKGQNVDTMKLFTKTLYRLEDYEKNVPILEKLAEKLEGAERSEVLEWLGYSLMKMNEIDRAEEALHKSLAFNENSIICLSALGEIYTIKEQWSRAVSYYQRAMSATKNQLERGEIVFAAASIYSDKLGEKVKAVELYEKLLEIEPGHPKAVKMLTDYYSETKQWAKAAPLLHVITTESGSLSKSEQVKLFLKAGRIALAIDKVDNAADYLEKARELEPTSLDVLLELAELRFRREEWDGALSLYQALLVAHRDSLSKNKIAEIYTRLGSIKETNGDTLKAISFYDKALEFNPSFDAAAEAVLKLREDNQDYDTVAKIKKNKIDAEKDEEKKLEMMSELVRFYVDTVKDPEAAIAIQEQALQMRPSDRTILNDSLDLYHLCEQWEKVCSTVLKLADLEEPGLLRSKYHYSAGLIFLEEVGDDDRALEQFNLCLDHDPDNEEVFLKIMEVHESREDWHNLAKAIRRQLKRDPQSSGNILLWDKLGTIYMDQMGDYPTAIAAFEAAAKVEPTVERSERLAKLYVEAGPDYFGKAEDAYMDMLQTDPQNVSLVRGVLELAKVQKEKDKVLGMCSVLSLYKVADEKEQIFFDKYASDSLVHASSILTDDLWLKLQSPEESRDLNTILSGLGHPLSLYYAVPHKDFGIVRNQAINIDKDSRPFVKAYEYVSRTLLIKQRPDLYAREGLPILIQLANTKDKENLIPSWFLEEKRFEKMDALEAAFHFARELPFLRPERLFRREAPAPINLMDAIYASFHVLVPKKAPPMPQGREGEINKLIKHIHQFVAAATLESLKPPASRFVSSNFENSVKQWIAANHKTSLRAAALITTDTKRTLAWVLAERDNVTGMMAKDRVAEVVRFLLSKEYYELRDRLGLKID